MDYEEKYKKALEKAKRLYEEGTITESLCHIFPELAESEDEKIRKALITHCRNIRCVTEERAEDIVKWIVWLEKQETSYTKRDVEDAYIEGVVSTKNELEKQGEPTLKAEPSGMKTLNTWSEEDENVLNNLIAFLKVEDELQYDWKQIIIWLESLKERIGG